MNINDKVKMISNWLKAGYTVKKIGQMHAAIWKDDFKNFGLWSIQNGYEEDLTIDRIDPNKNYSPDNCRWCNWQVQQNNRTNNHRITFNGEEHTVAEWARITGIKGTTLHQRFSYGWDVEKTLTTPTMTPKEAGDLGRASRYAKKKEKDRRE